jgi:hypothetical protein
MVVNLARGRLVRLGACSFWRQRNQERWTSQRQRHVSTALLQQHTPAWSQKGCERYAVVYCVHHNLWYNTTCSDKLGAFQF